MLLSIAHRWSGLSLVKFGEMVGEMIGEMGNAAASACVQKLKMSKKAKFIKHHRRHTHIFLKFHDI